MYNIINSGFFFFLSRGSPLYVVYRQSMQEKEIKGLHKKGQRKVFCGGRIGNTNTFHTKKTFFGLVPRGAPCLRGRCI